MRHIRPEYKLDSNTAHLIEDVISSAHCHHMCMAILGTSCQSFAYDGETKECMVSWEPALFDAAKTANHQVIFSLGKLITVLFTDRSGRHLVLL